MSCNYILRLKCILNPLDVGSTVTPLNGDDIKPGSGCGGLLVCLQVVHCRHNEFLLFTADDGFRATAKTVIAAVTNLYKNDAVVVLHHKINLTAAAFVVFFNQLKAVCSQVVTCGFLRLFTDCNTRHATVSHRSQWAWYTIPEPRPGQLAEDPAVFIETQNTRFTVVTLIGIGL